jgi:hypothetical protein
MPTNRTRRTRGPRGVAQRALTLPEVVELVIGPHQDRPAFPDDGTRRAAWAGHRGELVAGSAAGMRPWAWWVYDKQMRPPTHDAAVLWEAGELHDAELEIVQQLWRRSARVARMHAASAARVNGVGFEATLASHRRARGIPEGFVEEEETDEE